MRGVIDLVVLAAVDRKGRSYGYSLLMSLSERGIDLKGGTLYPLLSRLEAEGLVSTEWAPGEGGPGRKYFTVTDEGRAALRDGVRGWRDFSERVAANLHDVGKD